jgi:tetratricopeptide (TPR) repeat protein
MMLPDPVKVHSRPLLRPLWRLFLQYCSAKLMSVFGDKVKAAWKYRELAASAHAEGISILTKPCLEKAIRLAPHEVSFRNDLGWLYYEQRELKQAETEFEGALEIEYSNSKTLIGLATTLHELGRLEDAVYYYLSYLTQEPNDVTTMVNLGILFQGLDRYEESLDVLGKAMALDANNALVHEYAGRAYYSLGRFPDSEKELKLAIDLDPRPSSVHNALGLTYELLGDDQKAEARYREAIRRDLAGDQGEPRLNLARLLDTTNGDATEALDLAKKAETLFRLQGQNDILVQTLWELGWIYYRLGRWQESIQASAEAVKLAPNVNPARFNLALATLRSGNVTGAKEEYQRTLDQIKDVSELKNHGIRDLEEALKADPNLNGGKEILGMLYQKEQGMLPRIDGTRTVRPETSETPRRVESEK